MVEPVLFGLAIFGNLWIWRVFQTSFFHFLVSILASITFIKGSRSAVVLLAILVAIQVANFKPANFIEFSNDEIRVRDERLSLYPDEYLQIGYYYEQRSEIVVLRRFLEKLIRRLDPNLYFFAGHPRERLGVDEFEKYPYVLFPVFLLGVVAAIKEKRKILALFVIPLLTASLDKSTTYDFALFPFIGTTVYLGLVQLVKLTTRFKYKIVLYSLFLILFLLSLVQIISYEIF